MASEQFTSHSLSETVAQAPLTPTPSSQITPFLNPSSKPMSAGKENGISGQVIGIIGTILTALVAGGSSPWWWGKVFGGKGKSEKEVFTVEANDTMGHAFQYPIDKKSAKIEYEAVGTWVGIPIGTPGKVATGPINADGYSGFEPNHRRPCPDFNIGALVVRTEDGKCVTGGRKSSFMAEPGITYHFLMNDVYGKYDDNEERMEVTLHY